MRPYSSKGGKKSGVTAFQIGRDYIVVQFNDSSIYKYSTRSAGNDAIQITIKLAKASQGLSTYIAQNDPGYE